MRGRKLDRRISIYTVSETQSGSGAPIQTSTLLATVSCEQRPTGGHEGTEADRDQARGEKVFRIRWRSDVTRKHTLVFETVTHDIVRIDELERRRGLDITAVAKVS
jgi:SPP1 family predicted phage head-tail adaptor